jgi:hypothetical protein
MSELNNIAQEILEQEVPEQEVLEIEQIDESGNSEIPFDPKDIDITTKQLTLDNITKRIKYGEIKFPTEFQRHPDLWDDIKQSSLIESILLRLPLPSFYFNAVDDSNWDVVDGLQRLSAIRNYVVLQTLKLKELEYLKSLNGLTFSKLPRDYQRRIEETNINSYIINSTTPAEVKFNLFKRINTGGLILKAQEIRHALNQGVSANFVAQLANLTAFKEATFNIIPEKRMEDRDFVTRFLAFYLLGHEKFQPDLDTFMTKGMKHIATLSEQQLAITEQSFEKAMQLSIAIFGKYAFQKMYFDQNRRYPINKALFETWSVLLAKLPTKDTEILREKSANLISYFKTAIQENEAFVKSISFATGDSKAVQTRFSTIAQIIQDTLSS